MGGGIRDVETARKWLDAGATKVILGTAAVPEILSQLPRDRVMAAVDAVDGEVVVKGWRERTGQDALTKLHELSGLVGGFLVTFVEREGRLGGTDLERVKAVAQAAGGVRVTSAGGITTVSEIAALDRMGVDAQVGMALYSGVMDLADAISATLTSDRPDGLFATIVCDERDVALGLAWSDQASLREAVRTCRGVYHSRTRGLWVKGLSSGDHQDLLRIDLDCDRDAMRFTVRQHGRGFCHEGTRTCFGEDHGIGNLQRTLAARAVDAPAGSYTRLLLDDAVLLRAKLVEEAGELADAAGANDVAGEAADVMYFTLVAMARAGVSMAEVEAVLDARSRKVSRRKGDAKV